MKKQYANCMLALVAFIWGSGFLVTDHLLQSMPVFAIMSVRFLSASVLYAVLFYPYLKVLSFRQLMLGCQPGIFLFLAFMLQITGLQYTTPGKNAFLSSIYVILMPFLVWMLQKLRPKRNTLLASLLCMAGIGCLTFQGSEGAVSGDLLSLCSGLFFALQMYSLKHVSERVSVQAISSLQMMSAGMLSLVLLLMQGTSLTLDASMIGPLLYIVLIGTAAAYFMQNYAQRFTSVSNAALLLSLESLFAGILSVLLQRETLSFSLVCGALCMLASIVISEAELDRLSVIHKSIYKITRCFYDNL